METTENNKLIAEFMGYVLNDNTGVTVYYNDKTCEVLDPDKLKFHSDWNWLMEVVEKIEKLGYWTECRKQLGGVRFVIGDEKDFKNEKPPIVNVYKDLKIEAVYTTCVEFIEWYNQQNQ